MAALGIFKNAFKSNIGNTWKQVYTAPLQKTSYIIQCDVANVANTGVQISVRLKDNSASASAGATTTATVTGSVSGTVLNVTAVTTGTLSIGDVISGTNITPGSTIISFGTGSGGTGTYNLSASSTASSTAITATAANIFLVKNAPIPVGSSIQIVSGQKVVLEPLDSLEVICDTSGTAVDVIVSLIEDV